MELETATAASAPAVPAPAPESAAEPTLEQVLKEEPRLRLEDLRSLQEWLAKQPHLPPLLDVELVPFVVCCAFSLERAKDLIDKCMTMRTHAPELFSGRDPALPENKEALNGFHVARLSARDPSHGLRVVGMGYSPCDAAAFDPGRSLRMTTLLMELAALEEPHCAGYVLVLDAQHLSLAHLARLPLATLQRLMAFLQEGAPMHIEAVHIIHITPLAERAIAMVRPFMSKELQRMLRFHSGEMEAFYEALPKDILPVEYGGTQGSVADYHSELVQRLQSRREWALLMDGRTVNEALRPDGGPRTATDVFGPDGSFKRIEID